MKESFDEERAATEERARLYKAHRRLHTDTPVCTGCGHTYAHAMELHHIVGFGLDGTKVIECRNCHRRLTDQQQGWPEAVAGTPPVNEIAGRLLLGLADISEKVAPTLRYYVALAITLPTAITDLMVAFADFIEGKVSTLRRCGREALGYAAGDCANTA